MEPYTLRKTRLVLVDGVVEKRNSKDQPVAKIRIDQITGVSIRKRIDVATVAIVLGVAALMVLAHLYISSPGWRLFSQIILLIFIFLGFTALKQTLICITTADDDTEFQLNDMPDEGQAFVAMLNQERRLSQPNKSVQTTAMTPPPSTTPGAPLSDL